MLLGCTISSPPNLISITDDDMELADEKPIKNAADVKSVGIYVDATPSAEGFIGWGNYSPTSTYIRASGKQEKEYNELVPLTVYRRCLKAINGIISSNFPNKDIRYYCMDTTLWKTENNILVEAEEHVFYQDSASAAKEGYVMVDEFAYKYDSSYSNPTLSYAIRHTSEEDFAIVITDLCENRTNSIELINQLKQIRAERGDAVSIELLGIKSEFAGRVYDLIGIPNQDYGVLKDTVEVTENDIKYRPFYIILIGGREQIKLFTDQLYKSIDVKSIEIKNAMFDDCEVNGLDYRDYIGYETDNLLSIQTSDIAIYNREELTDLRLVDMTSQELNNQEKIYLFYDISSDSLREYLKEKKGEKKQVGIDDNKEPGWEIKDYVAEQVQLLMYKVEEDKFYDENIKEAVKVDDAYMLENKDQIVIECSFYKNEIENGIYKFSGKVRAKEQRTEDKWIQEWNSTSNTFEGEKTQNLNHYYNAIQNTFSINDQDIVNFSFYFRVIK